MIQRPGVFNVDDIHYYITHVLLIRPFMRIQYILSDPNYECMHIGTGKPHVHFQLRNSDTIFLRLNSIPHIWEVWMRHKVKYSPKLYLLLLIPSDILGNKYECYKTVIDVEISNLVTFIINSHVPLGWCHINHKVSYFTGHWVLVY